MSRSSSLCLIATIGVDLGKNSFHLVARTSAPLCCASNFPAPSLPSAWPISRPVIRMEACAGAHHIGRQLQALGHDVRLIPAQYVKPFPKGHKNDYRDAEAIPEAVNGPPCPSWPSRPPTRWTSRLCTGCALARSASAPARPTSSAASFLSGASPCARGSRRYVRRCQASWVVL